MARVSPRLFLQFRQFPRRKKKGTRSPHGPLAIPCENCHISSGWRPIRAVPEFDHNKTKYPLRGMHEKVQCIQCHLKPVFTDVGKNCADCHADIIVARWDRIASSAIPCRDGILPPSK